MSDRAHARVTLIDAKAAPTVFSPLVARFVPIANDCVTGDGGAGIDAYARGFAEGRAAAAGQFADERRALLALLASANAFAPEPSEELAVMIATTVERLVTELVGTAPIDGAVLAGKIDKALACIAEADAARTLWLHPDDIALLGGVDLGLAMHADASLERGALRIDCSSGWIEDSRSIHLDALRDALGIGDRT